MPSPLLPLLWPAASLLACLRQKAAASGVDGLGGAAPASFPPPAGGRSERANASLASVESAAATLRLEADPATTVPWDDAGISAEKRGLRPVSAIFRCFLPGASLADKPPVSSSFVGLRPVENWLGQEMFDASNILTPA